MVTATLTRQLYDENYLADKRVDMPLADILAMPELDVTAVSHKPSVEVAARNAYDKVSRMPALPEERYAGSVPVRIHGSDAPYRGVTEFRPEYHGKRSRARLRAAQVGIKKGEPDPQRVLDHEAMHVKSEPLVNYVQDIPEPLARLLLEGYAEFRLMKTAEEEGRSQESDNIYQSSPYKMGIRVADRIDKTYVSELTGQRGIDAFAADIVHYKSGKMAWNRAKMLNVSSKAGYAKAV